MKTASGKIMHQMDLCAIEKYGIPGIVLMENAARSVFEKCIYAMDKNGLKSCIAVCGTGNNGGDGFAAARMLSHAGKDVAIYIIGDREKIKGDAKINYDICLKLGIEICSKSDFADYDLIIDALLGTGFKGALKKEQKNVIESINKAKKYVISIDIPSGTDCDSGKSDLSVLADETVTFVMAKTGMLFYPATENCGKITVADIGMPKTVIDEFKLPYEYLTKADAKKILPPRMPYSNKGTFGKVFVFAGSKNMMGASYLCCEAAYNTGCGLVYACIPQEGVSVMQRLLPEAVEKPLKTKNGFLCKESLETETDYKTSAKCIAVGSGLGNNAQTTEFVFELLKSVTSPIVIDADALNAVSENIDILKKLKHGAVLTPHIGEMSRLCGKTIAEIKENILDTALEFSEKTDTIVVLKDARTVIASPDGRAYINISGCNAMAKGGSGDVLTGIISSFIAQGMDIFEAAALGVFIHGKSGEEAARLLSQYSVKASDIAKSIGSVLKKL